MVRRCTTRFFLQIAAIILLAALWSFGFFIISSAFGAQMAAVIFVLLPLPVLLVASRLFSRWPTVKLREIGYLFILSIITTGAAIFVVRDWYDKGLDYDHAEDKIWSKFGELVRRDSAFQNVTIKLANRKRVYYVEGTVNSNEDLQRLQLIAHSCGIKREKLDGPFVHSVSLTVLRKDRPE